VTYNPRSRLAWIVDAIDAVLHPIKTAKTSAARRRYTGRHHIQETLVLPVHLARDDEPRTGEPERYVDWLEQNPDMPMPSLGFDATVHSLLDDHEGPEWVRRIAARFGVEPRVSDHSIEVTVSVGAHQSYRVLHIWEARMAEHYALMSYSDNVQPEAVTA